VHGNRGFGRRFQPNRRRAGLRACLTGGDRRRHTNVPSRDSRRCSPLRLRLSAKGMLATRVERSASGLAVNPSRTPRGVPASTCPYPSLRFFIARRGSYVKKMLVARGRRGFPCFRGLCRFARGLLPGKPKTAVARGLRRQDRKPVFASSAGQPASCPVRRPGDVRTAQDIAVLRPEA